MTDPRVAWLVQRSAELLNCTQDSDAASLQAIEAFLNGGSSSLIVSVSGQTLSRDATLKEAHTRAESLPAADEARTSADSMPAAIGAGEAGTAADAAGLPGDGEERGESKHNQETEHLLQTGGPQQQEQHTLQPSTEVILRAYTQPYPKDLQGRPCVHWLRKGSQPLQLAGLDTGLIHALLPKGPTVQSLQQVLLHVFTPWLTARTVAVAHQTGKATSLAELLVATQRFTGQLEQASKQLSNGIQLPVPQGVDLSDPGAAAKNEEALAVCEQVQEQWLGMITSTLQTEGQRQPQGRGPLVELAFWQERSAVYSRLYEQLSLPVVKTVQAVVERGSMDPSLMTSFKTQLSDLTRVTLEARDNVKFLLTLERHFKTLASGSLQSVADTLHPMLNALRMIWIISRYFGDDVRMSSLLERISHALQDRLYAAIDVQTIFKAAPAVSIDLVKTCKAVADGWYDSYLENRAKLEESGHEARWEFSRQLLFEGTKHASEVCSELLAMLEAVDDFCKFLGPELKAVTGDGTVVDEVARMVQAMVTPVESVHFNIMNKSHSMEWKGIRMRFHRDADDIKLATRDLIDTCFRKLRNVEAAAHLLQSFKRIQTQGAIQRQMEQKLTDVLEHFIKEVNAVRKVFNDSKDNPPLTRNMPPVAGAIRWARGLSGKIKRTMARLQSLEADLGRLEAGQRAMAAWRDLAKAMLQFEKQCYETWKATAEQIASSSLQQPILCKEVPQEDEYLGTTSAAASEERLVINLAPGLLRLVREAKYLDQLGFALPELVVNAALQERRLRQHVEELRDMLSHYYQALEKLHSAERVLLLDHLARLEEVLAPGLARINWNSLCISEFAAGVNKAIEEFEALVAQIGKSTLLVERVIRQIATAPLVPPEFLHGPPELGIGMSAEAGAGSSGGKDGAARNIGEGGDRVPDMQEAYETYEQHRLQVVEGLVAKYRSITPLLLKVEELVTGTSTGKAHKLAGYYAYWERRIFAAVNTMVLSAIDATQARLRACSAAKDGDSPVKPPALMVTLSLIQPEVVLTPAAVEVTKQWTRGMRNLAESAKAFVRWQDGTCLECEEQYPYGEDSEPYIFSFFQDVSQNPAIIKAMLAANHIIQKGSTSLTKYLEGWKRYSSIWKADKAAVLAKFKARRPSHTACEEKLAQYHRMLEEIEAMPSTVDLDYVRVNCVPLLEAVKDEARAWLEGIACIMNGVEAPVLQAWEAHLLHLKPLLEAHASTTDADRQETSSSPEKPTVHSEEALAAVETVLACAADAEAACADLEERARTKLLYSAGTDRAALQAAELNAACHLRESWRKLAARAAEVRQQHLHEQEQLAAAAAAAAGKEGDPQAGLGPSQPSHAPSAVGNTQQPPPTAPRRSSAASRASGASRSGTPMAPPSEGAPPGTADSKRTASSAAGSRTATPGSAASKRSGAATPATGSFRRTGSQQTQTKSAGEPRSGSG